MRAFDHMVVGHQMLIAEFLRGADEPANGIRIAGNFGGWVSHSDFH